VPPPSVAEEQVDAKDVVLDLLFAARRQLEAAEADRNVAYRERAALISSATGLCRLLARLSGSLEVTQASILRSAAWSRILRAFERVASRHPEAARALAEFSAELQEIEA
jgi:hypothetical protein